MPSRTFGIAYGEGIRIEWDDSECTVNGALLGPIEIDEMIATLQRARREAYGGKPPMAVTMEIVERGRSTDDTLSGSLIIPSDVRINGVSVVTTEGVRVHEMTVRPAKEMAVVTVTLPVRLLIIGAEGDLERR